MARKADMMNQGIMTVMTPPLTFLLLMPSRAIDSMTDHFCRKRADASCMFMASTLTRHARRPQRKHWACWSPRRTTHIRAQRCS
jgi:hypothetical protein